MAGLHSRKWAEFIIAQRSKIGYCNEPFEALVNSLPSDEHSSCAWTQVIPSLNLNLMCCSFLVKKLKCMLLGMKTKIDFLLHPWLWLCSGGAQCCSSETTGMFHNSWYGIYTIEVYSLIQWDFWSGVRPAWFVTGCFAYNINSCFPPCDGACSEVVFESEWKVTFFGSLRTQLSSSISWHAKMSFTLNEPV